MLSTQPILLLLLLLSAGLISAKSPSRAADLAIGAFNVRIFGLSYIENEFAMETLTEILIQYDLVLIQEIRDQSQAAIYVLMAMVNTASANDPYSMVLSDRLGTSSSKEQYAYLYRESKVKVLDTYQFPEDEGIYERPPFCVLFETTGNELEVFGFIGIHTQPADADKEIDALTDSYDQLARLWGIEDIILGGDFNAGCGYVADKDWEFIRLWTEERFQWLIGHDADTTISNSDCPYDRLVLAGSKLQSSYVEGSVAIYRFDEDMGLTQDEALEVSDHYPVEMKLS